MQTHMDVRRPNKQPLVPEKARKKRALLDGIEDADSSLAVPAKTKVHKHWVREGMYHGRKITRTRNEVISLGKWLMQLAAMASTRDLRSRDGLTCFHLWLAS